MADFTMVNKPLKRVVVVGGTHGNEIVGIQLVRHIPEILSEQKLSCTTFKPEFQRGNEHAISMCVRYVDSDLNRAFGSDGSSEGSEKERSAQLRSMLTKDGTDVPDMVLDIHSSTSNCGIMLICSDEADVLMLQVIAALHVSPALQKYRQHIHCFLAQPKEAVGKPRVIANLGAMAAHDFGLEVGPQAHGTLGEGIYAMALAVVMEVLSIVDGFNAGSLAFPARELEVFRLLRPVMLPTDEHGQITAMVSPNIRDYDVVKPGEPLFVDFKGRAVHNESTALQPLPADGFVPIFVGESAYWKDGRAFTATAREKLLLPALCAHPSKL